MIKKIRPKGLGALIPLRVKTKPERKKENVFYVEIRKIRQTREQLEKDVNKKILKELTESIRKYGVIQPLELAKVEKRKNRGINVYYQLVSGQKRLLAAKSAGLRVVPAKIKKTAGNDKI
ncbi:MAG: ParB N-terminal domain-containing protein [Parcubacteria group bacterium]|nr:ParB N-terminal domain-containing protein [Parcubacteria group bacterium]